jgi:hypothetical protein
MSPVEPRTVVEDWSPLRAQHLLGDPARARTVLVGRSSLREGADSAKRSADPVFIRPAAQKPTRRERIAGRWAQGSFSRRESVGLALLLVALVAVLSGNRTAADGEPASDTVTISEPRASDGAAQQAVLSRLEDARQRREERLARDRRAVAELVQEQRERLIAARAKEEALAQLRGRRTDPALLDELRDSSRAELEERASALLASGETQEALGLYRTLEASSPGTAVYSAFVQALERRLHCEPGLEGAPEACL